jgi:hypothetical protein
MKCLSEDLDGEKFKCRGHFFVGESFTLLLPKEVFDFLHGAILFDSIWDEISCDWW